MKCLYCLGEAADPLVTGIQDRLGHVAGRWDFLRCANCGSAILDPQPDSADLASLYPPVYDFVRGNCKGKPFSRWLAGAEYHLFFKPQYRAQARHIRRKIGGCGDVSGARRWLDIGSGQGVRLSVLEDLGYPMWATDIRQESVDFLQKERHVSAVCANAAALKQHFKPASFHVISAFHVLEHLPDPLAVLRDCLDLLVPGGWFVGVVPLADSVQARLWRRRWAGFTEAPRHLSVPSQQGIRALCERAGFRQVSVDVDSLLDCAGAWVLSMAPAVAMRNFKGRGWMRGLCAVLVGGAAGLLALPCCLVENYILRRPAMAIVFARKPEMKG